MPSFSYDGELVACIVSADIGRETFTVGEWADAIIDIVYGEKLGWDLKPGSKFHLNVASEIIANGEVIG